MKLPLLLAQFLYQNHQLNLPGIGSFAMDPNSVIPEEKDKETTPVPTGISFQNKFISKPDDDLVEYIKSQTGKMKSLATSDLESYIALGHQLLNIGKPLFLEGIGTLIKTKNGSFEFTPGEYTATKLEDLNAERPDRKKSVFEETHDEYQPQSNVLRKLLIVVGILGGLFIIGWGGYTLYKKNMHPISENSESAPVNQEQTASEDTTKAVTRMQTDTVSIKKTDTVQSHPAPAEPQTIKPSPVAAVRGDTALYRFVIFETTDKDKAVTKFKELNLEKARLFTKDSTLFKIFFYKHAPPKDTAALKSQFSEAFRFDVRIERPSR